MKDKGARKDIAKFYLSVEVNKLCKTREPADMLRIIISTLMRGHPESAAHLCASVSVTLAPSTAIFVLDIPEYTFF